MRIKTNRAWQLDIERVDDCIEIIERHDGSDEDHSPFAVIPYESIDDVVFRLLQFKRRIEKGE